MSEEQVTGSTESSTATEAPNTAGKSEDSQSADASTGSPSPEETHVKTEAAASEQNSDAEEQCSDALEVVLKDRTFLDRILDAVSPSHSSD